MTYSKEKKLTLELVKNNKEKFNELKSIINQEIILNKNFKENLKKAWTKSFINNVVSLSDTRQEVYNKRLKKYNDRVLASIVDIKQSKWNKQKIELQKFGKKITSRVKGWLKDFNKDYLSDKLNYTPLLSKVSSNIKSSSNTQSSNLNNNDLLSAVQVVGSNTNNANACIAANNTQYKYTYKWIYIVEWSNSYRLFDYTDELLWNENTTVFNLDSDSDNDLLYSVWDEIFIKENLSITPTKKYLSLAPLFLPVNSNKFLNWSSFIESVNNASEINVSNESINLWFSDNKWWNIDNYRLEYYTITDKINNLWNNTYIPKDIRKTIVDSFAWIDNTTKITETNDYILNNNLWYIRNVWNISPWVTLKTKELIDIKNSLLAWKVVNLASNTKLYAGNSNYTITYSDNSNIVKTKFVWAFKNIEFKTNVQIKQITGSAFITWWDITLTGSVINTYKWMPVLLWTKIDIPFSNNFSVSNYIDIRYYDNSNALINFKKINRYEVYDLGYKSSDYLIRVNVLNDYFYARIFWFKNNVFWTLWKKILLSPQKQADTIAPELLNPKTIKIPVYQTKNIDFTPMIYENTWIKNIKDIYIDFNLNVDSNWDWDPTNDRDTQKIVINKTNTSINITFWPYSTLFSKEIGVTIVDNNGNIWYNKIPFLVYTPTPEIKSYTWSKVSWLINESLTNEPVWLYRYRWWMISKISWSWWTNKAFTSSWLYDFNPSLTSSWLELKYNNNIVANINETTWVINLLNPTLNIKVLASNSTFNTWIYPKITINKGVSELYYENIKIWNNSWLKVVNTFSNLQNNWIYLKFTDKQKYNFYQIPSTAPYNPWSIWIYRSNSLTKQALFSIYPDGRIDSINLNDFILEYSSFNNYVVIKLMDKVFNREVAQVMYVVSANYIMK